MSNHNISSSPHENAALLYLQAGILVSRTSLDLINQFMECASGKIEPNEEITKYVRASDLVIDLLKKAADIPNCDWGLHYSLRLMMSAQHLTCCRHMASIILIDARICIKEGNFKKALDHCITTMKMGHHITEGHIVCYLAGARIIRNAIDCIRTIFENTQPELTTLLSLKEFLSEFENRHALMFYKAVETDFESQGFYTSKEFIEMISNDIRKWISSALPDKIGKYAAKKPEKFFTENKKCLNDFKISLLSLLDLPYAEAYPAISQLYTKIKERINDPEAAFAAYWVPDCSRVYNTSVKERNLIRILLIAVKLYIIKAETKDLPDRLPPDLPKDLFRGEDFEYKKTDDGFTLRCQAKDLNEDKIHEYLFRA